MIPRLPRLFVLSLLALTSAQAQVDITKWRVASLDVAAGSDNNWYFHPDADKNPRVLVKAASTTASVNRKLLTGGPPIWTAGAATATPSLNKQGVAVQFVNGLYFIAPHNNALRLTFFNAAGTAMFNESIDTTMPITSIGLSAALDTGNGLHVSYIGNAGTSTEKLGYAFRSAGGVWTRAKSVDLTTTTQFIKDTAVLPSGTGTAKIYLSLKTGTVNSLLRLSVTNNNIVSGSGDGNLGNNIAEMIAGNRLGGVDRLYYFQQGAQNGTWNLKQVGSDDPVQVGGLCLPTSIICKPGPDAKQRIVWTDGLGKKFNYLKPGSSGFDVINPLTNTNASAQVRGLHFDANGKPFLLYRNSGSAGFIAFPDEEADTDGNGRADIIDYAFNSSTAGVEVLDVRTSAPGVPLSENKFKFRIPTIGSTISNGTGSLISVGGNVTYGVETSTDAVTWTTLGNGSPILFAPTSVSGTPPNELKTYTGLYNETLPNATKRRFFRITVKRTTSSY